MTPLLTLPELTFRSIQVSQEKRAKLSKNIPSDLVEKIVSESEC